MLVYQSSHTLSTIMLLETVAPAKPTSYCISKDLKSRARDDGGGGGVVKAALASLRSAVSTWLFIPQGEQERGCRVEEAELCRSCHHIKICHNATESRDTAASCQSNLTLGLKI